MTRSKLAHLVACSLRVHLRANGRKLATDSDQLIWDTLSDVTRRSAAADVCAGRLDRAPIAAESRFVRLVRRDDALEGCLA